MNTLVFYGIAYGISCIPLKAFFYKIYRLSRHIRSKMDRPKVVVAASAWQFLIGVIWILEFLKGFCFVWLSQRFLYSDVGALLTPLLVSIGTFWSPLNLMRSNRSIFWVMWGILSALWYPLIWLFPTLLIVMCLLLDSIYFGMLITLVFILGSLFLGPDPFIHVPVALGLFVLTFFLYSVPVFRHFEKKPITLLGSFRRRP